MSLLKIDLPAGISRAGTLYQTQGRWYDSHFVRSHLGNLKPLGASSARLVSTLTGAPRAIITWRANDSTRFYAVGTHSKLYAATPTRTAMVDITPAGFTAGRADASNTGGYGAGLYGTSTYGDPRVDNVTIQEASVWTLDTFGQYLIGCMSDDGVLYEWALDISTPTVAAAITNAPTGCTAVVVTPESIVMALGAGGDRRKVQWSDQGDETSWTPTSTNMAGDYTLQTQGQIVCGKRTRAQTLIFTDLDVHLATFIGLPYVYSINRAGEACGIISKGAAQAVDSRCFWMGQAGFFVWDGASVTEMACEVDDAVFAAMNTTQRSKVTSGQIREFSEVWWAFPSTSATENDTRVRYNYLEDKWYLDHDFERLCGTDRGVYLHPLGCDSTGQVYDDESGASWDATPYITSGPLESGDGDTITRVGRIIFDEGTQGDVQVTVYARDWNNDSETTFGPYTSPNPVSCRIVGRALRMKVEFLAAGQWGAPRFDTMGGSKR